MAAARKKTDQRKRGGRPSRASRRRQPMIFSRKNYQLFIGGLVVVVIGYVIMRLDNQVDGFISLYIAPVLILGGYLEVIYAIIYREKPISEDNGQAT